MELVSVLSMVYDTDSMEKTVLIWKEPRAIQQSVNKGCLLVFLWIIDIAVVALLLYYISKQKYVHAILFAAYILWMRLRIGTRPTYQIGDDGIRYKAGFKFGTC